MTQKFIMLCYLVILYLILPTTLHEGNFLLEIKFRYFANGKFGNIKFRLLLNF